MRWIWIMLFGIACAAGALEGEPSEAVDLYFLDFSAETFHPVTITNIESKATCHVRLEENDNRRLPLLHRIWANNSPDDGVFDHKRVRLKLVDDHDRANYVDSAGRLLGSDGLKGLIISGDALSRLLADLEELATAEGCAQR